MIFFETSFPHVALCNFFSNPRPSCVIYEKVTNYNIKQKNSFFYILLLKHINLIIEEVEKARNFTLNVFETSLSHIIHRY